MINPIWIHCVINNLSSSCCLSIRPSSWIEVTDTRLVRVCEQGGNVRLVDDVIGEASSVAGLRLGQKI